MTGLVAGRQIKIDRANSSFWNDLCGTQLAKSLGIENDSASSLERFDQWYFDFYPYLYNHIPFVDLEEKDVLEVGLGYGTVAHKIAESGARYIGLDIAEGPVAMVNRRIAQSNLSARAVQGSVLDCPFPEESFDCVIAVGSLHHTGNLPRALSEVHRVLRPGGCAMVMVYNAVSYRQWCKMPVATLHRVFNAQTNGGMAGQGERMRRAYDVNLDGEGAPETVFVTTTEMKKLCRDFASCKIRRENIGAESMLRYFKRKFLNITLGPSLGLDLYCHLKK